MFLTLCSPRSSKLKSSLSRTWSRTTRLTQIPPGSASASRRGAALQPPPARASVAHHPADADPAGFGERFEAGRDIDAVAVDVVGVDDDVAEIDAHAQLDPP